MDPIHPASSGRHFTDAARAAAMKARRLKKESALPTNTPEVFAVRFPPMAKTFGWEIRRFGSVVLERSTDRFDTAAGARAAGEAALTVA